MESFDLLTAGLSNFAEPYALFLVVAGSLLGILFGAIPG